MRSIDSGETMLKLFKFDSKISIKQQRLLNDWNKLINSFNTIDTFFLFFLSQILIETPAARLDELDKSFLNI